MKTYLSVLSPQCVTRAYLVAAVLVVTVNWLTASPARAADAGNGKTIFDRQCAVCHGDTGHGDGPAAALMSPRPRNFQKGLFKLRSTESGELPTTEDLVKTVTNGMPGTGMPSFRDLDEQDIADAVVFLKTLGGPESEEGSWFSLYETPPPAVVPAMPVPDDRQLALGKELYTKMGCIGCHGETGKGDAKPVEETKDDWGEPLHPRNYSIGVYKGGSRPEDLYLRVLTGLDGTPMTGFWKDAMNTEERWAVVRYITSFGKPLDVQQSSRSALSVSRGTPPLSLKDPAWDSVTGGKVARMALSGGYIRYFEPIDVGVVADDGNMAIRASWDDGPNSCASLRIGFAPVDPPASFVVGSEGKPMTVWQWKHDSGASVLLSSGPGRDLPTTAELGVEQSKQRDRFTVVLKGALPRPAGQMLVSVAGCTPQGTYLTSSTANILK